MRSIITLFNQYRFGLEGVAEWDADITQNRGGECRLPNGLIALCQPCACISILRSELADIAKVLPGGLGPSQCKLGRAATVVALGIGRVGEYGVRGILYRQTVVLDLDVRQGAIAKDDGIVG